MPILVRKFEMDSNDVRFQAVFIRKSLIAMATDKLLEALGVLVHVEHVKLQVFLVD